MTHAFRGSGVIGALVVLAIATGCGEPSHPESSVSTTGSLTQVPQRASGAPESGSLAVGSATSVPSIDAQPTVLPSIGVPQSGQTDVPAPAADVTVTDVRVERHGEFDRVLFTLTGDGAVFWQVKTVAQAIPHGGGARVDIGGAGILQIDIMGTSPSTSSGVRQYDGPVGQVPSDAQSIVTAQFIGSVDQVTQAFVGTAAARPVFSVQTFSSPARIAVDVFR